MAKQRHSIQLTEVEARAVRLWLLEASFGEPEKALVDDDWPDDEIDEVMSSISSKFNFSWE